LPSLGGGPDNNTPAIAPFRREWSQMNVMTSQDVLALHGKLKGLGIRIWIDGGWCIDALLGRQTREHKDLDVAIEARDVPRARDLLEGEGYREVRRESEWNFVMGDRVGREIDLHAFVLDASGRVAEGILYPNGSLTGTGTIDGVGVRCIGAEQMVAFHRRRPNRERDAAAIAELCTRFGIPHPAKTNR